MNFFKGSNLTSRGALFSRKLNLESVAGGDDDCPLYSILEFTHIAGPIVIAQGIHTGAGYAVDMFVHFLTETSNKKPDERGDVGTAITKGGIVMGKTFSL